MAYHLRRAILATSITHYLFLNPTSISSSAFALTRVSRASFAPLNNMSTSTNNENDGDGEKSYIDKLALILINQKKQQLVARSYNKSVFYTPGGKREMGESDIEALVRECKEELSIDLSSIDLLSSTKTPVTIEPYGTFEAQAYGKPDGTMVRITSYRVTPVEAEYELEGMVKASEEVEELKWIDSSFDPTKLTVTGIMILEDLSEKGLID